MNGQIRRAVLRAQKGPLWGGRGWCLVVDVGSCQVGLASTGAAPDSGQKKKPALCGLMWLGCGRLWVARSASSAHHIPHNRVHCLLLLLYGPHHCTACGASEIKSATISHRSSMYARASSDMGFPRSSSGMVDASTSSGSSSAFSSGIHCAGAV